MQYQTPVFARTCALLAALSLCAISVAPSPGFGQAGKGGKGGKNPGAIGAAKNAAGPVADGEEFVDVHFHLVADKGSAEGFEETAQEALKMMDAQGISKLVVMSPPRPNPNFDVESLAAVVSKYSPRLVMFGGGGTLNPSLQAAAKMAVVPDEYRRRFQETAEGFIAAGAKGFGEITAHHVSLQPSHGYEAVAPDHPLLLLLADIAAKHGVPIDLHFDPVPEDTPKPSSLTSPRNPPTFQANVSGFERLLAHNRKAVIVWAHAGSDPVGFFKPQLVRDLLGRHPNLYLSIRPTHPSPDAMLRPQGGPVNSAWMALLLDFPDRFVLGSDTFVVASSFTGTDAPRAFAEKAGIQHQAMRRLLGLLPPDVARRIARENAERIYKLK